MPELPEVEAARKLLELHCVGKRITLVNAVVDDKVFEGVPPEEISAALINKTPLAARRLGKHCYLDFGPSDPALLLHLGMTGGTVVRGKGGAHYQRYSVDDTTWPPKFLRLELHFADGTQWAFCDSRRFARIRLIKDPLNSAPLMGLGWDPLLSWPSLPEFSAALTKQRRAIKAVLLDQSFTAGVGNWVADEVLYQSRIHPEQAANSLSTEKIEILHKIIKEVCHVACDVDADSTRMPESWLFHHRWGKGAATKAKIDGHAIDHITVGGRTSAYVPALQKLVKSSKSGGDGGAVVVDNKAMKVAVKKVTEKAAAAAAPSSKVLVPPPASVKKKVAPIKTKAIAKSQTSRRPASSTTAAASTRTRGQQRKI
jgi:formamidopyrimidine-DNA glycosylase